MNYCLKLMIIVCLVMLITTTGLQAGEIHDAVAAGDLDKVRELLEADPSQLEAKDNIEQTPLMFACRSLQLEVAYYLINKGANVNVRNKYGLSVLCYAMDEDPKCVSLVKRLIEHGADVKMWEGDYEAPLHAAVSNNNPEVVKLLIKHGANPNVNSDFGTPLQKQLLNRVNPNERISKFLVENGARALEYSFDNTDLHLAAMVGFADVCTALVQSGAEINAKNEYDRTPLYYAANHGHRKAADVLIAAGADKGAIEETNYGKAPQLTETLREGEAYLWYLGGMAPGTGYAVKTKNNLLIFDPFLFGDSPDTYLAQGNLNPRELTGQKITILLTRKEPHPYMPTVEVMVKHFPKAEFIISAQENLGAISEGNRPVYRLAKANECFSFGNLKIHTIRTRPSTLSSKGNLGYLVEVDGLKVFHAGIHWSNHSASQIERFRKQIDFLKPFGPIDLVILPAGWHHLGNIDYKQNLYLIDQLSPKAIYYIGDDQVKEEHRRAVDALNERDVPVYYPDGGIALGQRFHYRAPDAQEFTDLKGDYLGQTPPGDTPVVFARGIVSTDLFEHSAPAFSPDGNEVFWSISPQPGPHLIMTTHRENGGWSAPTVASFSGQSFDSGPVFSLDGRRIYLMSVRPRPGEPGKAEIWFVEKQGDHWGKPARVGIVERYPELQYAATPTIVSNGTLYFQAATGICRAELVHGEYAKPQVLPRSINLPQSLNWTPFIAPDESYLIFSSDRRGQFGNGDLYISFHDISANTWSEPVNMGKPINTSEQERFPGLSPDGKYFFFTRGADIFWVSARIIEKLKAKAIQEQRLKTHAPQEDPK